MNETTYNQFNTFILFGPPGAGKTRFASHWLNYAWPDGTPLSVEIADVGRGLSSFIKPPPQETYHRIKDFKSLVKYLAGIEERKSDVIIIDDLSFLNYKLTMQSAQIRLGPSGTGKDKDDLGSDVKELIQNREFVGTNFIPPMLRDRGIASEKLRILLYNILEIDAIVMITCGEMLYAESYQEKIGDEKITVGPPRRTPNLPGKLANDIPYFTSEVFYFYVTADVNRVVYKIRTQPDGKYLYCVKDRSDQISRVPSWSGGVMINDKAGKTFDEMVKVMPWPSGRVPMKVEAA